jgi:tungstate transport system ATP-binding protein
VAVVGRNGSGKTTLLRILAFLERPASWEQFTYQGRAVVHGRISRDGIGLLKQQPWIFQGTVAENLAYGLRVRRLSSEEIKRRVNAVGERLGLGAHLSMTARSLSGGEQKRLSLGRILVTEPRVLLLDEPMAHLDRISQDAIENVLVQSTTTAVFTTRDLPVARRLGDRILNLEGGQLTESLPENTFEGVCHAGTLTTRRGLAIRLPVNVAAGTVTVAIDPRAIVLSLEPFRSSMRNAYQGCITAVREYGSNVWLEIDAGEVFTSVVSRESYRELRLNVHGAVIVQFKANAVRLL